MKKKILAVVAAVGLFSSGVYAGGNFQEISVSFDAVKKIVINGVDKTPTTVKPFIYNGSTYVPLRYISEQLNTPVSWDEKTGTVYLGAKPVSVEITMKSLTELPIKSNFNAYLYRIDNHLEPPYNLDADAGYNYPSDYKMKLMINSGGSSTTYENGISLKGYGSGSAIYYDLKGEYAVLKGTIGYDAFLNKEYKGYNVRIYGDDKVLQDIQLSGSHLFENVEVSLAGIKTLRLELISGGSKEYEPFINFVNPLLEQHTIK